MGTKQVIKKKKSILQKWENLHQLQNVTTKIPMLKLHVSSQVKKSKIQKQRERERERERKRERERCEID